MSAAEPFRRSKGRRNRCILSVEQLEDRIVPSFFPSTTNGVHVFEDQLPGGLSNALIQFMATHTDGTQKQTLAEINAFRAYNPNYTLIDYRLGTMAGPPQYIINGQWSSDWTTVNSNESWFAHQSYSGEPQSASDLSSGRIIDTPDNSNAMDISNPSWQNYWLTTELQDMKAVDANGVFADSFTYGMGGAGYDSPPLRYQGTNAANPSYWPGGITWTDQLHNWAQTIETAFVQHNATYGTDYLLIPNLDARVTAWEPNWVDNASGVPIMDGAFLEGFGQWTDTYDWTLSMNRGLNFTDNNKIVIMQPYFTDTVDSTTGQQERNFYMGTYLLLKGDQTYINMGGGMAAQYYPEYQLNLGAPTTPLPSNVSSYLWNGVYRRDFQNGFVLVNPGSTSYTLNLGGTYQMAQGHGGGGMTDSSLDANGNYIGGYLTYTNMSSITMAGGTAAIFLDEPPAAPTNLTAAAGNTQVALTWNASSGAASYDVYRALTSGGEGATPIATGITGTNFTDTGLIDGTAYYYEITAVNAAGQSGMSNEVSAIPQVVPPSAPTNLIATAGNAQIALTWTASSGASSYDIYRGTTSGGETLLQTGVTSTSFTDTGLTNGTTYYYEVSAVNAGGQSGKSNQVTATPQLAPPAAPTNLLATAGNAQVALTWTASSGATSYDIYRGTSSGGETLVDSGITAASFTDTGLTNGTTYYYEVSAVNAGGQSGKSNQVSATPQVPPPAAPTNLVATAGNAQVALTWTASTGATSYDLYRGSTSGGETLLRTGVASTSFTDTSLTNGTTYYYEVSAVNAGGQSGKSNEATATPKSQPLQQTIGIFDPSSGNWYLRNSNSSGAPDIGAFSYGAPGWYPIVGDWNGDGATTIGVVDLSTETWYLRNSNSPGAPSYTPFQYGVPGWIPIAGDWTGTGHTGIGVFDPSTGTWYLRTEVGPGAPDAGQFQFGGSNWKPVVGDWTGQGKDTIGVVDPSSETWYLRNSNSSGAPDFAPFAYGGPGWSVVAGDWNGTGHSGIGVFAPGSGTWYLRNEVGAGTPDGGKFRYGGSKWDPIVGDWDYPALPQLAEGGEAAVPSGAVPLTEGHLQTEVQVALNLLASDGVNSALLAKLSSLQFTVGQLPAGTLGLSDVAAGQVEISADAAGYGWFVDATASDSVPANRMDLLTVVLHEMGHFNGWTELDPATNPDALMALTLGTGERRIQALDAVFAAGFLTP